MHDVREDGGRLQVAPVDVHGFSELLPPRLFADAQSVQVGVC